MPHNLPILVSIILAMSFTSACSTLPVPDADMSAPTESTYLSEDTKMVGDDLYVGGQPGETDVAALAGQGITHVVNFRTPAEMERLDFDQAAMLKNANITYTNIPIGGDTYKYSPASMEALGRVMESRSGPVLLHCGSGYRASVVTVAWLVETQGMPMEEALTHAQGWWPLRLEEVMGRKFTLVEE